MDDDLTRIRENKMRELQEKMEQKKRAGVLHIDERNFNEIVGSSERLVIDFWAEWCGPCKRVGPVIEELAKEYAGTITFAKCNTDENARISMRFGISAIPTIIFFAKGKMVDQVVGAYPKDMLNQRMRKTFRLS
jgi:thioredoxin 1